jgi:hypothetical protein
MAPRVRRALKAAGIGVIALAVLAAVIDRLTPSSSGPTSSSYSSSSDGLAGYAELLSRSGHPVMRLRTAPSRAALDPRDAVVMLDPDVVLRSDIVALRRFVRAGGVLIAGGREPDAWLDELLAGAPSWTDTGETAPSTHLPVPQTAGVGVVETAGTGSWSDPGGTLPVIGEPHSSLLTLAALGAGQIDLLADSSPLQNRLLDHADNAQLGLSLAGAAGRAVAFEEASHGFGGHRGLGALPTRWKWALLGLVLAALLAVAARFRRLGPPTPPPTATPPPRRVHVEALASALARTGHPGQSAEPVHRHVRALVLRRAGLPASSVAEPDPETLAAAAERLGLDPDEIHAIVAPELADSDLVAAGRALSKLTGAAP